MAPRSGLEKLSGEHAAITETKAQSFIHRVFGNRIEFVADVSACARVGRNRNCSTAGVIVVIGSGQPEPFKLLFEFPLFRGLFLDTGPEVYKVPAADQIGKAQLIVIRRIDLVKGIPLVALRIFRSRSIIALEKNVRRGGDLAESLAHAGITGPRGNGRWAKRSSLSVEFGVVIEISG